MNYAHKKDDKDILLLNAITDNCHLSNFRYIIGDKKEESLIYHSRFIFGTHSLIKQVGYKIGFHLLCGIVWIECRYKNVVITKFIFILFKILDLFIYENFVLYLKNKTKLEVLILIYSTFTHYTPGQILFKLIIHVYVMKNILQNKIE